MPNMLLTNMGLSDDEVCFWPEFIYHQGFIPMVGKEFI